MLGVAGQKCCVRFHGALVWIVLCLKPRANGRNIADVPPPKNVPSGEVGGETAVFAGELKGNSKTHFWCVIESFGGPE